MTSSPSSTKNDSLCAKEFYCLFEVVIDRKDAQVDRCVLCGKRVIYNKDSTGRTDNRKYGADHIRDFAQPSGPTANIFARFYGNKPVREFKQSIKNKMTKTQIKDLWKEVARDINPKRTYL